MGVKRGKLELISGLLLPFFILNYMIIRVKERGFDKKNRKNKERERESNEKEEKQEEGQSFGKLLA